MRSHAYPSPLTSPPLRSPAAQTGRRVGAAGSIQHSLFVRQAVWVLVMVIAFATSRSLVEDSGRNVRLVSTTGLLRCSGNLGVMSTQRSLI